MRYPLLVLVCLLWWGNTTMVHAEDAQPSPETPTVSKPAVNKPLISRPGIKDRTAVDAGTVTQAPAMATGVLQVTLGLFVVLIVIAAAAWFARRFGHFNVTAKGNLRIIGGLHMGSRERVVLMQVGNKQLLLGVAPGRIQTLHVLDEPITVDEDAHTQNQHPMQRFSTLLKRYQQ
jgi:flagellar biosynthetic protein FliO